MGARPVWRVRDRASFDGLRRDGRRVRRGPVSVVFAPGPDDDADRRPAVAFAIGRTVGGAVARNRLRRRLRAILDELAAAGALPAGTYLVSAGPEALVLSAPALRSVVADAIDDCVTVSR